MNLTPTRGFLAALSCGVDITTALDAAGAAGGSAGAGFRAASQAAGQQQDLGRALSRIRGVPAVVATLCATAPSARRPAVAEYLLSALGPARDAAPSAPGANRTAVALVVAMLNVVVGTGIVLLTARTLPALPAEVGATGVDVELWVALALFAASALIAAYGFRTAPRWAFTGGLLPRPSPHRTLLFIAAGAEAGVGIDDVLRLIERTPYRALRSSLPPAVVGIAERPWGNEAPGRPWARAAWLARTRASSTAGADWPAYASVALSSIGIGLIVLDGWRDVVRLAERTL